jgi:hypothetical protein
MTNATTSASSPSSAARTSHRHTIRPAWTLTAFVLLGVAIAIASRGHDSLWLIAVGIIGPDLSFLAAVGATPVAPGLLARRAVRPYNLVHTPITATLVLALGMVVSSSSVVAVAISWLSHIAWDRGLGYRLRNPDGSIRTGG